MIRAPRDQDRDDDRFSAFDARMDEEEMETLLEPDYCRVCDGTGEGMIDGRSCSYCRGTGFERSARS